MRADAALSLRRLALAALALPALGFGPCADERERPRLASGPIERSAAAGSVAIAVAGGPSPEQALLRELYAQALSAAGFDVERAGPLAQRRGVAALRQGRIDGYPAYARNGHSPAARGLTALARTPFSSGTALAVRAGTAARLELERISDLGDDAGELTLYGPPGCRRRGGCLDVLREVYGLSFRRFVAVREELRHEPLRKRLGDVSLVRATDPQLGRNGLVVLADDGNAFARRPATLVVRERVARRGGRALRAAVSKVAAGLTNEVMQELRARVELDQRSARSVASDYLRDAGLVR